MPVNTSDDRDERPSCPKCASSADVVPVRYGYFALGDKQVKKDVNARKYVLGGCVARGDRWYCHKCGKMF
jgi:hypothetical protein